MFFLVIFPLVQTPLILLTKFPLQESFESYLITAVLLGWVVLVYSHWLPEPQDFLLWSSNSHLQPYSLKLLSAVEEIMEGQEECPFKKITTSLSHDKTQSI